ncbi:LuxR family transcriptional regulator [Massilia sp. P8910]|uniref:LuxR family transcriptional regulator n=1 Tax=Massilia antarctica TaxID=2765360 RepID=UPI0006BB8A9D|nr:MULTISPECIES: LuxR family transcriptional regulator [Massilia]MCE3604660.1 LuxR family transcriptional regulator [Massilia antarctica]MCY0916527.1 LuxR family transcriptional regulator [Massilia sp. H27-R4]
MQIHDVMHEISTASSSEEGFNILKEEALRLGMEAVSWVLKPPVAVEDGKIATFDSYAPEWRERYFKNNYLACDPTVKHGLTSIQPLLWSQTKALAPEFWEDADSFGLRVGFAQSLWDRHGCCSMLSLSRDRTEFSQSELALKLPQLSWLAQIAHTGMVRHIIPAETINAPAALSRRETEILQLVSTGLTSQQIADRLRVTKATVDRHMEAVRSKLHAENKVDAVVKAIRWGLI